MKQLVAFFFFACFCLTICLVQDIEVRRIGFDAYLSAYEASLSCRTKNTSGAFSGYTDKACGPIPSLESFNKTTSWINLNR